MTPSKPVRPSSHFDPVLPFPPLSLPPQGPFSTVHLRRWDDRPGLRFLGPYMAASHGGTVFLMARTPAPPGSPFAFNLYMYAVVNAPFVLPGDPPAPPPPPATNGNGAAVAGALLGTFAAAGLGFAFWGRKTRFGGHGSAGAWAGAMGSAAYSLPGVGPTVDAASGAGRWAVAKVTGRASYASMGGDAGAKMSTAFTSSSPSSAGGFGSESESQSSTSGGGFQGARGGYGAI